MTAIWRYPDPRALDDNAWKRRKAYGEIMNGLERQLRIFMALPFATLDRMSLREQVTEIGRRVRGPTHVGGSRHEPFTSWPF